MPFHFDSIDDHQRRDDAAIEEMLTMTTHTPEPWSTTLGQNQAERIITGLRADMMTLPIIARVPGYPDANAARIVACVNACQGLPTEDLEAIAKRYPTDVYSRLLILGDIAREAATDT